MAGPVHGRHRLAVLPGLGSRSGTASVAGNDIITTVATVDNGSNNRQLIPLYPSNNKLNLHGLGQTAWNGSSLKSRDSEESFGAHLQGVVSRIAHLEEANKAILEEFGNSGQCCQICDMLARGGKYTACQLFKDLQVYRLQSNVRSGDYAKKEIMKEEKKEKLDLMDTIRCSNDIISQLTSRLRKAEEKLHREKESVQNLTLHSKKLEQALLNSQKEADVHRDSQNTKTNDLRHRVEDLLRRSEKSDRTSENIVDEFHQMKSKVDLQAMEYTHLQNEVKQRTKRMEEEMKQNLQQARFQKETHQAVEQNNLQLRHLFESRMAETRDAVSELRSRIGQTESDSKSQIQQVAVKLSDLQSNINDASHRRQEDIQALEKSRQELRHAEENERIKLHNKIQGVVEEISEKLLQKEVRLREEALKKFIDVEKLFQKEESSRTEFEKQLRVENEERWNMHQKLYSEEIEAMKEMRRSDRTKQMSNQRKSDEYFQLLEKKMQQDRKSVEKVLLAEIRKREEQSSHTDSRIVGVQEQLRVALSSLQQAIGGVQFQASKEKDQLLKEVRSRVEEEGDSLKRSLSDVDARLNAISMRITQLDTTYDSKVSDLKLSFENKQNQLLHSTTEWRDSMGGDITSLQEALKELPQEVREAQERLELMKTDFETRSTLETKARLKDGDVIKNDLRHVTQRVEELVSNSLNEKSRRDRLEGSVSDVHHNLSQIERTTNDIRQNFGIRINSETKMRMEETGSIKRDLARLRIDIQPFLWQQHTVERTFVKKSSSCLNEWGIYQCARWYDIKMRWMRLLGRNSKKSALMKRNSDKNDNLSRSPSQKSRDLNIQATDVVDDVTRGDSRKSVQDPHIVDIGADVNDDATNSDVKARNSPNHFKTSGEDSPISVEGLQPDATNDDGIGGSEIGNAEKAWYNRNSVVDSSREGYNTESREGSNVENREGFNMESRRGSENEVATKESENSPVDDPDARKYDENELKSREASAKNGTQQTHTGSAPISRSGSEENIRRSPSKGTQPRNGGSTGSKASTRSLRDKHASTTGGGLSYDMEGRR